MNDSTRFRIQCGSIQYPLEITRVPRLFRVVRIWGLVSLLAAYVGPDYPQFPTVVHDLPDEAFRDAKNVDFNDQWWEPRSPRLLVQI
jgi:hypothetical protein